MELADPQGSYAVLIGSSRYADPGLDDLPAVAGNVQDLGRLLADPAVWGLPQEHCIRITDPGSQAEVLDAVHEAAQRATDSLLVYYAGHGLPGPDGDGLLLALPGADPERPYSWLDFRDVRREVLGTGKRVNRVVVLDCCYSGQALAGGMSGPVTLTEQARIAGTYLLTSTSANTMALSPPGEPHTAFTGELIRLLDRGLPGAGPLLTAPDLYDHLVAELRSKGRPLPQQRLGNTGRTLAFARNRYGAAAAPAAGPAVAPAPAPVVPEALRELLRSAPRVIADRSAELAETDPEAAGELLRLAALTRPAQEAAALTCLLSDQAQAVYAYAVLRVVAEERSPGDLAVCVRALRALEADEDAERLLRVVAEARRPEDIAGTIRFLTGDAQDDAAFLLEAAVGLLVTTGAVLDLAGALWSAELDDYALRVLKAPAVSSPREAARLSEALCTLGRPVDAAYMYAQVIEAGHGDPAEVVRLLRAADEAGTGDAAELFVMPLVIANAAQHDLADLCDALWDAGMGERATHVLTSSTERLSTAEVIALGCLLHAKGHDGAALGLFGHAAGRRPVVETTVLARALREMGRPLDARQLLVEAAGRPVEEVAALLAVLDDQGAVRDRSLVLEGLSDEFAMRSRVIRLVRRTGRPYADLLDPLCLLPDVKFAKTLAALREQGDHDMADTLLHRLVHTSPDAAFARFQYLTRSHADLLDRAVLQALLHASGRAPAGRLDEVETETISLLVVDQRRVIGARIAAIEALSRAGLSERADQAVAAATRDQPPEEVVQLLRRLEARELWSTAQAVVRTAASQSAESYRDLVQLLLRVGLLESAAYAAQCNPHMFGPGMHEQLTAALARRAGADPAAQPPAAQPPAARLLDRFRRR